MNEKELAVSRDFIHGRKPKILFLDEEVSPAIGTFYDAYKGPILEILQEQMVMSFAYQWAGEKTVHVRGLPDYAGYKPGWFHLNDRLICNEMYDVMCEADLIIGHNAKRFDLAVARSRFLKHGLPPHFFRVEDTLQMLWKYFRLEKNTLEYACNYVGLPGKTKLKHSDFLNGCINGNMKDWNGLKKYNGQDIFITKAFYEKISPWHFTHYNLNLIVRGNLACKICLANGRSGTNLKKDGTKALATSIKQLYRCKVCRHKFTGEVLARAPRGEPIEVETERVLTGNI